MMKFSKNEAVLKWTWSVWREKMKPMKTPYLSMVMVENNAARRNGYKDMGASWRDETEMPALRKLCYQLYESILPLYKLIHGVVRYQLRKIYGDVVPEKGPMPAHLLGDLWSQNWEPMADLILDHNINLDERIKNLNWTVGHMVKRAEDFYTSLGLPAMSDTFWRESVFARGNTSTRCHGTAADMFKTDDYRLLYCSDTKFDDLYVLHHEMGHIQYYMAYSNQPGLFRQANTALHEAIGDAIMIGVTIPQHLNRLGLLTDNELFNMTSGKLALNLKNDKTDKVYTHKEKDGGPDYFNRVKDNLETGVVERERKILFPLHNSNYILKNTKLNLHLNDLQERIKISKGKQIHKKNDDVTTDDIVMLKQALNKIPQIPFALVLDEYRWRLFEGSLDKMQLNEEFWRISQELQGISPVDKRGEEYFDVGAKYHVADNIPYTRYFLTSFLQYQLFEKLCKSAVFGHRNIDESLPYSIPLHRCDIYGSKAAGKILIDIMSRGSSENWEDILQEAVGVREISSAAIKNYFYPLSNRLKQIVEKYNIPIGWD
ncbi:unnamed protein product [Leptosia nina]|uniref:Angiotensin-converting enzyme n=1 Tax=Leptosia nina TaxID=320188 RepID=A0AAV1JIV9_9NEOP